MSPGSRGEAPGQGRGLRLLLFTAAVVISAALSLLALALVTKTLASFALLALPQLVIAGVLLWPVTVVYRRALWRPQALRESILEKRATLAGTVILLLTAAAAVWQGLGPIGSLLNLPLQIGAGPLYAAALPYRAVFGREAAMLFFNIGRVTMELVWLYLLADIGAGIMEWIGR